MRQATTELAVELGEDETELRPRILLADDSEIVRDALGQILIHSGYEVEAVADGAEAIRRLKEGRFDALLLDLQMPGHDGFEVLSYIQEHRRGLPTILLSGLPANEIQERMHKLTTGELPPLFLKPCDYEQLLAVLEMMLSGQLPTRVE